MGPPLLPKKDSALGTFPSYRAFTALSSTRRNKSVKCIGWEESEFFTWASYVSLTRRDEAAKIAGAGRWALFRHITLPLLSPTTFFLSVISIIGTFKAFNHIWILRDNAALGTTDTSSIYFFEVFFRGARFGYATAMAMVLFAVILALTAVQNQIAARRVFYG